MPCLWGKLHCSIRSDIFPLVSGKWILLKTTRSAGFYPFRFGSVTASSNQLPQRMSSMNSLSRNLFNRDESHSYPAKRNCDWKFCGCPGQVLYTSDNPKITDKYPSSTFTGYIDSDREKPLTKESADTLELQWNQPTSSRTSGTSVQNATSTQNATCATRWHWRKWNLWNWRYAIQMCVYIFSTSKQSILLS